MSPLPGGGHIHYAVRAERSLAFTVERNFNYILTAQYHLRENDYVGTNLNCILPLLL